RWRLPQLSQRLARERPSQLRLTGTANLAVFSFSPSFFWRDAYPCRPSCRSTWQALSHADLLQQRHAIGLVVPPRPHLCRRLKRQMHIPRLWWFTSPSKTRCPARKFVGHVEVT